MAPRNDRPGVDLVALAMYTTAMSFAVRWCNPGAENLKDLAKEIAHDQLNAIINAMYTVSALDNSTPHNAIQFYKNVKKKIDKL